MKAVLGIAVVLVVALGVWLSLNLGEVAPAPQPQGAATSTPEGWQTYADAEFSIQYPASYHVSAYDPLEGSDSGVVLHVAESIATGTNLSADTHVAVVRKPGAINSCSAEIYLEDPQSAGFVDEGGRRYSIASSTGAGAGNRYEEWAFATPVDGGCIAVLYFIHYGVLENYPEGAVRAFDRQALLSEFDAIRKTFTLRQ